MVTNRIAHKWGMVVDLDRCTGCQACVVACQAENNLPINIKDYFLQQRAYEWIRVERYWEGEFPNVKARFIPIMCQHCENAPCEPVCPVFATYHNDQGLNVQVYNRCIGTRYCANNCPYQVRFFNWWEPKWPERLRNQLNSDVSVRSRGIMERCSFCIQRIRRGELQVPPTIKGATTIASAKPTSGAPPTSEAHHQASTAPSMKNAPCATLTTRMTPKTSESPSAVTASTKAVTVPSSRARKRCGPKLIAPGVFETLRGGRASSAAAPID